MKLSILLYYFVLKLCLNYIPHSWFWKFYHLVLRIVNYWKIKLQSNRILAAHCCGSIQVWNYLMLSKNESSTLIWYTLSGNGSHWLSPQLWRRGAFLVRLREGNWDEDTPVLVLARWKCFDAFMQRSLYECFPIISSRIITINAVLSCNLY